MTRFSFDAGNRQVEIPRQALRTVRVDGDTSDRDVLDAVTRERLEQLAWMERVAGAHRSAAVLRLTAARPALNSEVTVLLRLVEAEGI